MIDYRRACIVEKVIDGGRGAGRKKKGFRVKVKIEKKMNFSAPIITFRSDRFKHINTYFKYYFFTILPRMIRLLK